MTQRGGKRPGAGRKPGKVGKAKRELAEMAQEYAPQALKTLAAIQSDVSAGEAARVSAAVAILDRAYGRPAQAMTHSGPEGGPIEVGVPRDKIAMALLGVLHGGSKAE